MEEQKVIAVEFEIIGESRDFWCSTCWKVVKSKLFLLVEKESKAILKTFGGFEEFICHSCWEKKYRIASYGVVKVDVNGKGERIASELSWKGALALAVKLQKERRLGAADLMHYETVAEDKDGFRVKVPGMWQEEAPKDDNKKGH